MNHRRLRQNADASEAMRDEVEAMGVEKPRRRVAGSRIACIALAVALCGVPAWAAPTAEQRAEAEAVLAEGFALFEKGRYVDAASAFEKAQAMVPDPLNLRNIARAYEKAERPGLALKWLDLHLASGDGAQRIERSKADRTRIASAYLGLLAVECTPTPAQVVVERLGEGVVVVDALGKPAPCPVQLELEPGRYQLRVTAEGFTQSERLVAVRSAQVTTEKVTLVSLDAAADVAAEAGGDGWALATMITGGALVAAGGVMHALNSSNFEDLESNPDDDGLRDTVDATAYGAIGGYGLGGALLIGGLVWYLAGGEPAGDAPAAGVTPGGAVFAW